MTDEHDIARMSRLSLDDEEELEQHLTMDSSEEGDDADGEHSDKRHDDEEDDSDEAEAPVTPGRIRRPLLLPREREYSSETDSSRIPRRRRTTYGRRAWEAAESSSSDCRVVARPRLRKCCGGGDEGGRLCMNIEEVKACRDLGFEIPFDWTVEIAGSPVAIETSSGGESSPISNWRISSPGDDPREVKARLKVWAQAVALATASHLSNG
ncbi:hypothetical protein QJS04_geneDACA015769 [Acorus gramineus]|uniref:Uncharacterized protein n=1 Tax=Acorus gramineus TaxID=55184 RepID=A0AAV9BL28_ACOGR|nr:hypothetical protein QJS04_geneDACA015769 [Acorus gramineus]